MDRPILTQIETTDLSTGEGRQRNRASTRVSGTQTTSTTDVLEAMATQSALRESTGQSRTSNVILPERGELPGDTVLAMRQWYRDLQREFSRLVNEATRVEFISEEWWELLNQIEIIADTSETILGFIRGT